MPARLRAGMQRNRAEKIADWVGAQGRILRYGL